MTLTNLDPASRETSAAFSQRLWALLARQAALYTQGDSTSLPAEEAQALLDGLTFTLRLEGAQAADRAMALAGVPLTDALEAGRRALDKELALTRQQFRALCDLMPPLPCRALTDTLASVGASFRSYDVRFLPHRMTCDIDYQLCCPVDEELRGIRYVHAYVKQLLFEADILRRFPMERIMALLTVLSPDWQEELMGVCEPVVVNGLGRSLLGLPPQDLSIDGYLLGRIARELSPLTPEALTDTLHQAAARLSGDLGIRQSGAQATLHAVAEGLVPRLTVALFSGDLRPIFREIPTV